MSDTFELKAALRADKGKGASRRLRRHANSIPAIIYGGNREPQALTLIRKDLEKALENEAFYSHVLTIDIDGERQQAILKDLQRHPAKESVTHADFLRVSADVAVKVSVPIHFVNEASCFGVKEQGGMIQHNMTEIEVQCLPADIPEFIEIDMKSVKLGEMVHLTDVTLPKGVVSVALTHGTDHDLSVASVITPRGSVGGSGTAAGGEDEA